MITHLEPDNLGCEVKWALGSITTSKDSRGNGIPAVLFQILKGDAVNMSANSENSAVATGLEKVNFHYIPRKSNAKECSNYHTIVLISHDSKVMVKSFKLGLNSM